MRNLFVLIWLTALTAVSLEAQTTSTGALSGQVTIDGSPLVGVTIEVRSSSLPGLRRETTNADGHYRFQRLPAGSYSVTASRDGFAQAQVNNVDVLLGQTATIDITMKASASERIEVSAAIAPIDLTTAETSTHISGEAIEALPLARNYTSVAALAPGVGRDERGFTFSGTSGLENRYVIDGVNVTGTIGEDSRTLSTSFVEEVRVLTGGLNAEYGYTTGGIINAVTRSGSNVLQGSLFGYWEADREAVSYVDELPPSTFAYTQGDEEYDYGVSAGGPVARDHLWFFGGFDRTQKTTLSTRLRPLSVPGFQLAVGESYPTDVEQGLFSAKLTYAPFTGHVVAASIYGDEGKRIGAVRPIVGPPSTFQGHVEEGGVNYAVRYSGIYGRGIYVDALWGRDADRAYTAGESADIVRVIDNSRRPQVITGGFGQFFRYRADRIVVRLEGSMSLPGNHTVKAGIDQEKAEETSGIFFSGGDRIQIQCRVALVNDRCPSPSDIYYIHTTWVDEVKGGFVPTDPSTFAGSIVHPRRSHVAAESRSMYLQDSWNLASLTINAGVRVEQQELRTRANKKLFKLTNPAPRLGVVWAIPGHQQKIFGFAGRYYESIPLSLNYFSSTEYSIRIANLDPTPGNFTPDPLAPAFVDSKTQVQVQGGGGPERFDADLEGQHLDEYILGYETALGNKIVVGFKGTHRRTRRIIENVRTPSGVVQANPGFGDGERFLKINGETVDTPTPIRRFDGIELHATKHFSRGVQFYVSYQWSRLYGNYEGLWDSTLDEYSLHSGTAYQYADYHVNDYGLLASDRTHRAKLAASYYVQNGLARGFNVGIRGEWASGAPLSALGYSSSSFFNNYFLTKRGTAGRGPSIYEVDVNLARTFSLIGNRVTLSFDIFNTLDRQSPTQFDQRYNTFAEGRCAGIPQGLCNGDGGIATHSNTLNPLGKLTDLTPTNPQFLKATAWSEPRSYRLSARFEF